MESDDIKQRLDDLNDKIDQQQKQITEIHDNMIRMQSQKDAEEKIHESNYQIEKTKMLINNSRLKIVLGILTVANMSVDIMLLFFKII